MNFKGHIIAEIGSVHDGSFGNAINLIKAAKEAGATAVKFQTHIAQAETLESAPNPSYFKGEPRFEYFKRTAFTLDQWRQLLFSATSEGLLFISSPFSLEAVDLLQELDLSVYKIPSGEVSNLPLLEKIASTKKPVILSTGMSSFNEIDRAVDTLKASPLSIMQCTSKYPCPPEMAGLNIIRELKERYKLPIGFSDHTDGFAGPIAAAAFGADFIEKHFTFSRLMYGSDAKFAMEPSDFKILSKSLVDTWIMRDSYLNKNDLTSFSEMKNVFEKSIVTKEKILKGTPLELKHIAFKKPGTGISAAKYKEIIGKISAKDLPANHQIREDDLL